MAATVWLLLADGPCDRTEPAAAAFEVVPAGLDVLLAAVQGTGAQVHGDTRRRIGCRIEEHHSQKTTVAVQIVVRGMPSKQACLADLVQRQRGSRGATLLGRPTDKRN